jgi:hypothetical protein
MKKNIVIFASIAFLILVYPSGAVDDCMGCHKSDMGFPIINATLFGVHVNLNSTEGSGNLTRYDCIACHYTKDIFPHSLPRLTYSCESRLIVSYIIIIGAQIAQIFLWPLLVAIVITKHRISTDTAPMQALHIMEGTQASDFPRARLTALTAMRIHQLCTGM